MPSRTYIPAPTPRSDYLSVIRHTQLISVDLIVECSGGLLMGFRNNSPAKGTFFVPGGRVFKHESMGAAVERVMKDEVNVEVRADEGKRFGGEV